MNDAKSDEKPRTKTSYTDAGAPFSENAVPRIYADLRELTEVMDDPTIFESVAEGSGTHILKIHNSQSEDHVLKFPDRVTGKMGRLFPSMNATLGKYAGMIFQPIAIEGRHSAKSLVDHILHPDNSSPEILESFAAAFSEESLQAVKTGILRERLSTSSLFAGKDFQSGNLPIIFVPAFGGGDLQLTPISALEKLQQFKAEVIPEKGQKLPFRTTDQAISAQMQNISTAIGGARKRFMATVPRPLMQSEAQITRLAMGAHLPDLARRLPAPRINDLRERIESLVKLHHAKKSAESGAGYYDSNMKKGMQRLSSWIIGDFMEWRDALIEAVQQENPDFQMPEHDTVSLLVRAYWPISGNFNERRAAARQAMLDTAFQSALDEVKF